MPPTYTDPIASFKAQVQKFEAQGMATHTAHAETCRRFPELRAAYVKAVNDDRPDPRKRQR